MLPLPVTATQTSSPQLPPGPGADAPRRRVSTLACYLIHWSAAQVNSPEENRYQENRSPSHRHLHGLATFSSPLLSNQLFPSACQHTIAQQCRHHERNCLILARRTEMKKEGSERGHLARQLYGLKQGG